MKRTILSLLVVGLFAGVGTSAIAQDVTAGEQPAANEQAMAGKSSEQTDAGKADDAAKASAKAEYKAAQDKDQAADSGAKPADDKVSEAPEQPKYPRQ